MSDTPYIVGEVLTTFFENPQNFYKVMLVRVIESDCVDVDDEICCDWDFRTNSFGYLLSF